MNPWGIAAIAGTALALLGGTFAAGLKVATATCIEEKAKLAEIARQIAEEQARRLDKVMAEAETLRLRPERVRTVVKEVKVYADAECSSLPPDWRLLWNALPSGAAAEPAAGVGDEGRMPVAPAAGRGEAKSGGRE